MNLFDNIIKQSTSNFLGTQTTPTVPSFMTQQAPQAPRTTNYVAPNMQYSQGPQNTGMGMTTTQKPINTSLPMGIPEPDFPKDPAPELKAKFGFNDKDIEFLRLAKQKGYDSKSAFEYITKKKEQEKVGEDLGVMGNIKEGGIGAFRAGEQIPRVIGSGLGYVGEKIGEGLDVITPGLGTGSKELGQRFQQLGSDITMAGMTDGGTNPLTQKQISARQTGGEFALTAPIGGGYLAGSKGVGSLALRSGVVGAGFGATQPIIDKGGQATVGDIATGGIVGGVTGAVAGPLIGKVIAPAIGSIASKTGKYGTALVKGGVEGAKKSIVRDVNAVKTGIQKGIQNRADIASTNINRMNAGQIRSFNEEIGVSPGKFLNDRGLNDTGDNLVENLSKNLKLSRKSADEGLANIKGNFKAPTQEIATATVDDTGKFVTKQVDPVETMLRDNLENASSKGMSKESLRAKQLLEKYQEQGLSMTEINEAKRFLNANNKFSYFSDDVSPRKGFVTNLDNEVRKWQFQTAEQQGFTNLKDINKDTKAYYKLLEGIGGWQDKIAGNNPMGLTDWLAFNADPSVFLAKQVAQSNIAKRGYLKGLNALGGRKVQPEIKKPTNLIKNDIPNSNNSGNIPSSKRINVATKKKPIVKPNTIKNESKVSEPVVVPKKTVNNPIVEKSGVEPKVTTMSIGKYKTSEILPTSNKEFSQRFTPESKIDEKTTKMATIEILDKNGKVIDEFSFSRSPSTEKQIQSMADELIRERVLKKYFNSKEFDSSLKELKNLDVNSKSVTPPSNAKQQGIINKSSDTIPKGIPKVIGLTDETANAYKGKTGGGIKNVEPGKQVKYNQGDSYEPVRMALTQKDADIARYGALSKKQMKTSVSDNEKLEMAGIKGRLKMSNAELETRAQELRDIAKLARSDKESVLVDLRNGELYEKIKTIKKPIVKPKK